MKIKLQRNLRHKGTKNDGDPKRSYRRSTCSIIRTASRTSHRDCHAFLRNARNDKPGLIYKGGLYEKKLFTNWHLCGIDYRNYVNALPGTEEESNRQRKTCCTCYECTRSLSLHNYPDQEPLDSGLGQ